MDCCAVCVIKYIYAETIRKRDGRDHKASDFVGFHAALSDPIIYLIKARPARINEYGKLS